MVMRLRRLRRHRPQALASSAITALLLAGCATTVPVPTTVETTGMPNPEKAMLASMRSVDAEMAQLGGLTSPAAASIRTAAPVMPEDLLRPVSFDWSGPLDKGVAKLAASIGYTFYTSGPPDLADLPITVQIGPVPIYQVFAALGDRAGTQATVELDALHHQVQVIHHG